jgi:hypothetical protein
MTCRNGIRSNLIINIFVIKQFALDITEHLHCSLINKNNNKERVGLLPLGEELIVGEVKLAVVLVGVTPGFGS